MSTRLSTTRDYVAPGVVIGEEFTPGATSTPEGRVVTFIGRGSRYIRSNNQPLRRGYIYDTPLSFTIAVPHVSALVTPSNGSQDNAVLIDGNGTEVRKDLWLFADNGATVQISNSVYEPTQTYFLSYQGASFTTPDPIPASDIRVIESVGNQISQNVYVRNKDFFVDEEILAPVPAVDPDGSLVQHAHAVPVFSAISRTGTGTAVVSISSAASFNHSYSRSYALTVKSVVSTSITFSWQATPVSSGNDSQPSVPFAAGLTAPTFTIDTANAQTLTQALELGIRVDFASTGTYVANDVYSFTVTGPSLIEVDTAYSNTNQYASASATVPGTSNTGTGSIVGEGSGFHGLTNTKFVMQVTGVDTGVTSAAVPSGTVKFSGNPNDSEYITLTNGYTGNSLVSKTFEFSADAVQSISGSTLVPLVYNSAVAATGFVKFNGSTTQVPVDGANVVITDGVKTVVFEFDADGSLNNPNAVRVLIDTTAGSQSQNTAANLVTAINSAFTTLVATNASSSNGNVGYVTIAMSTAGSFGNNTISTSQPSFILVSGFSGGLDAVANTPTTVSGFITKINDAYPRLGLVAYADTNNTDNVLLVYGSQVVFTGNPSNSDSLTIMVGGVATVLTFKTTATLSTDVAIGVAASNTMTNLVTAIKLVSGLTAVASVAGANTVTVASLLHRSLTLTKSSAVLTIVSDVIAGAASNFGNNAIISTASNVSVSGFTGGVAAGLAPDVLTLAWGSAGDVFTGGTLNIKGNATGSDYVDLYNGVTVKLSAPLSVAARGSITLNANPANLDTVTINDHVLGAAVVLTFKTSASLATDVAIGATATATAANLRAKIIANGLSVVLAAETGTTISMTHKLTGSAYNGGITTSSSVISVVTFAGGKNNYVVGDTYAFTALAPRKFVTALDTRSIRLTVGTVGANSSTLVDPKYISFDYYANTPEGGFGTYASYGANNGYFVLPGQIGLVARNQTSFVKGDAFDVELVNNNVIYWTLDAKSTETFTSTSVLQDRNGAITGKVGTFYIVLRNQPYASSVTATMNGVAFTAFTASDSTSIVLLGITATSDISSLSVSYKHRGNQPALGAAYYLSAQYVRPASAYNAPKLFYDRASARAWLDPVTESNDLAIANEIAFNQAPAPRAVAFVQIADSDNDGVFSPTDIDNSIAAALGVSYITDPVPVNLPNYIDKFLAYNVNACDPFAKKEHLEYFGLASGTPVGDQMTEGTMVYTAKNTLQVYGDSPAHGTRIMVGSSTAQMRLTRYDGTVITVTLDGSFVAAAIAAMVAGMPNNSTDILRKNIYGFSYIETFNDTINDQLGAASILYFKPNGTNTYQIMEDVTVDKTAAHYNLILAMKTKQDSVKRMRKRLDVGLVGYVADTKASGIGYVQSEIMSELLAQVGDGTIAPFQDEAGNVRQPMPSDIQVIQDSTDTTLYHFRYLMFTKTPIKSLWGVYSVNQSALVGSL